MLWIGVGWGLVGLAWGLVGCEAPSPLAKYPPGSLRVSYEASTGHTTCLIASVAMAANYLLDDHRFSVDGIIESMRRTGLDETLTGDVKTYLASQGLHLQLMEGRLDEIPPTGLKWWVAKRGYPAICVINREGEDPSFNHAVVVIGISANRQGVATDTIYYFDPSSAEPLHSADAAAFEILWSRGRHAMMIVVTTPPSAPTSPTPGS